MAKVKVLKCVDITEEYEPLGLDPGVRVFYVMYVNEWGRVVKHHISYSPRRGISRHPVVKVLQEECLKRAKPRRWRLLWWLKRLVVAVHHKLVV
jgi:hypothetical protein